MDRPLVLPAGIGRTAGKFQFMSEHEQAKLQKRFPDPVPRLHNSPKRNQTSFETDTTSGLQREGPQQLNATSAFAQQRPQTPNYEQRRPQTPNHIHKQVQEPNRSREAPRTGETLMLDEGQTSAIQRVAPGVQVLELDDYLDDDDEQPSICRATSERKVNSNIRCSTPTILRRGNHRNSLKERPHSVSFSLDVQPSPTETLERNRAGWSADPLVPFPGPAFETFEHKSTPPVGAKHRAVLPSENIPADDQKEHERGSTPLKFQRQVVRSPLSGIDDDEQAVRRKAAAEAKRPHTPSWSVRQRWTVNTAKTVQNMTHNASDGSHLSSSWQSSNLCNKDISSIDRVAMFHAVKKDQVMAIRTARDTLIRLCRVSKAEFFLISMLENIFD